MAKDIFSKGLGFQFDALWQAVLYQAPLWIIGINMSYKFVGLWGSVKAFTRVGNQIIGNPFPWRSAPSSKYWPG